jgi:hypothetical protein
VVGDAMQSLQDASIEEIIDELSRRKGLSLFVWTELPIGKNMAGSKSYYICNMKDYRALVKVISIIDGEMCERRVGHYDPLEGIGGPEDDEEE